MPNPRNILVTGGAGFIGSVVVSQLVGRGHKVTVVDSLEKGHLAALHPGASFIRGDLGSDATIHKAFSGEAVDAVMHFAAYIEAGESMAKPSRYFANNTGNALRLVDAAVAHGVKKFIFSSTAAVYGNPERIPIDESHPTRPTNAYGMAKLLTDQALDWVASLQSMQCISLRYFNASGAWQHLGEDHHPETHLIPILLEVACGQREKVSLFGRDYPTADGTCVRDYIHIADIAQAHLLALESSLQGPRHVFNLGNGRGFSNLEVVAAVEQVTGRRVAREDAPRRPGDSAILVASAEKIRHQLGWAPQHPELDDIIRSAWDWKQSHPRGYSG